MRQSPEVWRSVFVEWCCFLVETLSDAAELQSEPVDDCSETPAALTACTQPVSLLEEWHSTHTHTHKHKDTIRGRSHYNKNSQLYLRPHQWTIK